MLSSFQRPQASLASGSITPISASTFTKCSPVCVYSVSSVFLQAQES